MSEPVQIADANVLVALTLEDHADHAAARRWIAHAARFATTPMTETALVRLLLNPAITVDSDGKPLTIAVALDALRAIKSLPNAEFVADATSVSDARAVTGHITAHRQVTDTHLLNLAISQGGVLATFDAKIHHSLRPRDRKHVHVIRAGG
ncbi:PIN domain-containing protein [Isoptericola sp. NEAU-Y5]|uniref:Ribonuclease VapC n=1 Tax=Isoptericola luteus TaxID=2879484 RepID=A0ABS7ZB48_9MICO|nr:TA system VapC family ribonuclease toxin [Isoptericola sp. NEAU-Y5]MCA5892270.1 PIN domain-containing protein [Isoptericola sp. NEAU-Y5]